MTRYLGDIGPGRVPKSGHVTITKIENLHIVTRRKIHCFQECYLRRTRSSADADNGLDAFSGQSRSTNMVPFWVHCDFSLSM